MTKSPFLSVEECFTSWSPCSKVTATPDGEPVSTRTFPLIEAVFLSWARQQTDAIRSRQRPRLHLIMNMLGVLSISAKLSRPAGVNQLSDSFPTDDVVRKKWRAAAREGIITATCHVTPGSSI